MQQRIDECINDHPGCRKTVKPTFLPRRLLDLGNNEASSVKLIECGQTLADPEEQIQYATLSYCWGSSLPMTTTIANKYEHQTTGINIYYMPATFQDAIYITHQLELRYLWIDALCIIQDNKDDWEAESAEMCDIFAHSKITISAARSSNSAEHFMQRPIEEMLILDFHSKLKPNISGRYFIRLELQHDNPAKQDLALSKWVHRAWVWQEEIISSRQVVFGDKALQFRCNKGFFLADGRKDHDELRRIRPSDRGFWHHAVPDFSMRKLTYPSDRLKAIAGVAKFIETGTYATGKPTKYLAGLWQNEDFHGQLCWVLMQPSLSYTEMMRLFRDEEQYIAPSWSWASRNKFVRSNLGCGQSMIKVVKTDLRALHKSAMVSVAFGSSITLSGKFRPTPVAPSSGHLITDSSYWPPRWEAFSHYGQTEFQLDWVPRAHDAEESVIQRQLYLLLTELSDTMSLKPGITAQGLLIVPVSNLRTGVFLCYRVGVFRHTGDIQMLMREPEREITIL